MQKLKKQLTQILEEHGYCQVSNFEINNPDELGIIVSNFHTPTPKKDSINTLMDETLQEAITEWASLQGLWSNAYEKNGHWVLVNIKGDTFIFNPCDYYYMITIINRTKLRQ